MSARPHPVRIVVTDAAVEALEANRVAALVDNAANVTLVPLLPVQDTSHRI